MEQPAVALDDGGYRVDVTGWTCERWVLDIFTRRGYALGLEFSRSMLRGDTLYAEICKHARKLEGGDATRNKEWYYGHASDGTSLKYVPFPQEHIKF